MSEKKIEDYLHLYIGCEAKVPGSTIRITGVIIDRWEFSNHGIKPILRKISDISEIEFEAAKSISNWDKNTTIDNFEDEFIHGGDNNTEIFRYLLSCDFDLFGLIESGLAIDKTTLDK